MQGVQGIRVNYSRSRYIKIKLKNPDIHTVNMLKKLDDNVRGVSEGHFPLSFFFGSKWPKNQF